MIDIASILGLPLAVRGNCTTRWGCQAETLDAQVVPLGTIVAGAGFVCHLDAADARTNLRRDDGKPDSR